MVPNSQQQDVIDFGKHAKGSLNLLACAGTGKTTTLLQLVSHLKGATWFCAFNKAIVSEIQYKVDQTVGVNPENVRVSTVHSAGMKAWMKHCYPTKVKVESNKLRNLISDLGDPMMAHKYNVNANDIYIKRGNIIRRLVDYAKSAGFGVLQSIGTIDNWYELIEHYGLDLDADSEYSFNSDVSDPWYAIIQAS